MHFGKICDARAPTVMRDIKCDNSKTRRSWDLKFHFFLVCIGGKYCINFKKIQVGWCHFWDLALKNVWNDPWVSKISRLTLDIRGLNHFYLIKNICAILMNKIKVLLKLIWLEIVTFVKQGLSYHFICLKTNYYLVENL